MAPTLRDGPRPMMIDASDMISSSQFFGFGHDTVVKPFRGTGHWLDRSATLAEGARA
ncbi:MAG: hypothetical protein AAGI09_02075 [Pseudomonadota bacterium]